MGVSSNEKPNIYRYLDYRVFLKDLIAHQQSKENLSIRSLAEQAGFKTHSILSMALQGKRRLSRDQLKKLSEFFKLKQEEREFLYKLANFAHAKTLEEKDKAYEVLSQFKKYQEIDRPSTDQYNYFSHWYVVAILEALASIEPKGDIENLSKRFQISERQVSDTLELLQRLGLIKKQQGRWARVSDLVEAYPEISSLGIRNLHKEMISKAAESVDDISPENRILLTLSIGIKKSELQEIRKKCFQFGSAINVDHSAGLKSDELYQLNFQFFPLTKKTSE